MVNLEISDGLDELKQAWAQARMLNYRLDLTKLMSPKYLGPQYFLNRKLIFNTLTCSMSKDSRK